MNFINFWKVNKQGYFISCAITFVLGLFICLINSTKIDAAVFCVILGMSTLGIFLFMLFVGFLIGGNSKQEI